MRCALIEKRRGVCAEKLRSYSRIYSRSNCLHPLRRSCAETAADLKKCRADVKWVRPEAMHLTIKFLGDVRGDLIPAIEGELKTLLVGQAAMDMQVTGPRRVSRA